MKKTNVQKVREIHEKYKHDFSGGFHTLLWELIVNKAHESKEKSLTTVIRNGFSIGIAILGERGYIFTPAHFSHNLKYEECTDICDKLNREIFGLSSQDALEITLSTMFPLEPVKA